jgi:hypothetical protein
VIVQYGKDNSCTLDMTALVARRARPANRGGFEENVEGKVRCSAAIMVRRIRVNFGRLRHQIMVGRQMTHRVCRSSIASKQKGLTAAAPEIDLAPLAAGARFRQVGRTAKSIEGRRRCPDIRQRTIADIPELKIRNRFRGVTW